MDTTTLSTFSNKAVASDVPQGHRSTVVPRLRTHMSFRSNKCPEAEEEVPFRFIPLPMFHVLWGAMPAKNRLPLAGGPSLTEGPTIPTVPTNEKNENVSKHVSSQGNNFVT